MVGSALYGTYQDIFFVTSGNLRQGLAIQIGSCGNRKLQKFNMAAGKCLDFDRRGELEQTGCLHGSRKLRVDCQGQTELLADKAHLAVIDRITNTRDGAAVTCLLCDQAAQQVQFVRIGCRDHQISIFDSQILLYRITAAVADDSENIAAAGDLIDYLLVFIHDADIVSLFTQLSCESRSHFSAADHNDFHIYLLMPEHFFMPECF